MKKMLAMLLAVLLLAAPLSGLAEAADYATAALEAGRRIEWNVTLGDVAVDMTGEPAVDQVITDLLNALVISGYMQGEEVYYAIGMKQEGGSVADLLSVGAAVSGNNLYLMSNLIGGSIVVRSNEVVPLLQRLVDMFVLLGLIPESEAEAVKAQLPEVWQMVKEEVKSSLNASAALNGLDVTALNYEALLGIVTSVAGNMTTGEPDPLPRNCDPAVSMTTCVMTPEEMNAMFVAMIQFLKDNPDLANAIAAEIDFDNTIAPEMSGVAGKNLDFMGFLDMLADEIRNAQAFEGDVVMRIWMGEDGMPVAANVAMQKDGAILEDGLTLDYRRLSMNSAVAHGVVMAFPEGDISLDVVVSDKHVMANFAVAEAGETRILVQVDYTDRSEGNLQACDVAVDVTITEATVNMTGTVSSITDYTANRTIEDVTINLHFDYASDAVFSGVDFTATESLTVSVGGKEYVTVLSETATVAPGASIVDGNVVRPAALSDADFANWFVGVYTALFSWLQNALVALPSSVMNLINTGF